MQSLLPSGEGGAKRRMREGTFRTDKIRPSERSFPHPPFGHVHSRHPWRSPFGRLRRAKRQSCRFVSRREKEKQRRGGRPGKRRSSVFPPTRRRDSRQAWLGMRRWRRLSRVSRRFSRIPRHNARFLRRQPRQPRHMKGRCWRKKRHRCRFSGTEPDNKTPAFALFAPGLPHQAPTMALFSPTVALFEADPVSDPASGSTFRAAGGAVHAAGGTFCAASGAHRSARGAFFAIDGADRPSSGADDGAGGAQGAGRGIARYTVLHSCAALDSSASPLLWPNGSIR